ncbi:response regulator transcription factor [Streptomyces olivoverticillatus]
MTRVLLIHDTYLLRTALAALIGREPDLEVSSASWHGALATSRAVRPDVCVVDMDSPEAGGAGGIGELGNRGDEGGRSERTVGTGDRRTTGAPAPGLRGGSLGVLEQKNASPDRLVEGIRHVAKGERYIDESLGFGFLQAAEMPLTRRELSVLSLAAEGASIGEIARSLHLSNGTVRNYMAAITRKTGARNRVDAIRISRGAGWL